MKLLFKKLKNKKGSIKELLTDNTLLIIVLVLIVLVLIPVFNKDISLLNSMRNYQINHEKKIELR